MNKFVMAGFAIVVALLGIFLAKDNIQTALFDRSKFLDCFETEVISEYQSQSIRSGQPTTGLFESMLTPQIRSNANQIVDFVKKNGLSDVLQSAEASVDRIDSHRLEQLQSEGQMPERDAFQILSEAERICLARQVIW